MNSCTYSFPIGNITVEDNGEFVTALYFTGDKKSSDNESELSKLVYIQLQEYFQKRRKKFTVPIAPKGTPFQKSVWKALCEIPYGKVCSYKDIALKIKSPKACRAVGQANNRNPIAIIIPCHRVIGKNGSLTGYAGGLNTKKYLLELENIKAFD